MSFYSTCSNCNNNTGCTSGCCNCAFSNLCCENYFFSTRPRIQTSALPIARENFNFPEDNFAFYTNVSASVAQGAIIPLTTSVKNNIISKVSPNTNGTFTLSAGTYLVNFGSTVTNTTGGSVQATLALNANNVTVDTATQTLPNGDTATINNTALITVANGTVLSLNNTSTNTLTFANTFISITPVL